MAMTDPIADMLTRIRNAIGARQTEVCVPMSRMKAEILKILKEEGYVKDYAVPGDKSPRVIKVQLRYGPSSRSVITEIKRVSKPGKRVYVSTDEIPEVMNGLGVAVISTSKGVVSDREARKLRVGGEFICSVY
ncbi:MAG: 30S ribosomal protein S8 [Deltaproteobacteria bacterium]|nr:30S ribosomal protein S8 [Deltaproteobacteria bacterium]